MGGTGGHNVPLIPTDSGEIRVGSERNLQRVQGYPKTFKLPEGKVPNGQTGRKYASCPCN